MRHVTLVTAAAVLAIVAWVASRPPPLEAQDRPVTFPMIEKMRGRLTRVEARLKVLEAVSRTDARDRSDIAKQDLLNLKKGIELYRLQERRMPQSLQDLFGKNGVMEGDSPPRDPWGNRYRYKLISRTKYNLRCLGEDGQKGGEDDITLADLSR